LGQIANAHGRFLAMAWAPAINNIVIIFIFGFYITKVGAHSHTHISHKDILFLGVGTTLGYVIQAVILLPNLWKDGFVIRPMWDWRNPELRKSFHLASWTLLFAAISQISFLVTQNIATHAAVQEAVKGSTLGVGITPYNNSYYVMLLPHSIVTLSLITALLPQITRYIHSQDFDALHFEVLGVIRLVITFIIPSTVFLFFFAPMITRTIFVGIDAKNAQYLGFVLMGFAPGLVFFSLNVVGLRVLNAFENAKRQVVSNLIMNIFAVVLSIAAPFIFPSHWVTVVLASILSLSYVVGFVTTFNLLARQGVRFTVRDIYLFLYRISFISLISTLPVWLLHRFFFERFSYFSGGHELGNIVETLCVLAIGGGTFLFLGHSIKVKEMSQIVSLVAGKVLPSRGGKTPE
jgi:putative peptidoglycan lipid II flippase